MDSFIPLLRLHIGSSNPHVKELIVGWITTLDSVPDIEMLDYLPNLLSGLFNMLTDSNKEVKKVGGTRVRVRMCARVAKCTVMVVTWCLVPGAWCLVPGVWYLMAGSPLPTTAFGSRSHPPSFLPAPALCSKCSTH